MKIDALKINITQRILSISNDKILKKIAKLLDEENVIGYDVDGNSISEKEYVSEILHDLQQLSEGKLETYASEEIRKKILD